MAKSSRSSRLKKNNGALKKKVFGPVEIARSERLSAKLMELAQQPKPSQPEMEVEREGAGAKDSEAEKADDQQVADDAEMEVDDAITKSKKGNGFRLERNENQKRHKAMRVQKGTRHRKERNKIVFEKTGKARSKKR